MSAEIKHTEINPDVSGAAPLFGSERVNGVLLDGQQEDIDTVTHWGPWKGTWLARLDGKESDYIWWEARLIELQFNEPLWVRFEAPHHPKRWGVCVGRRSDCSYSIFRPESVGEANLLVPYWHPDGDLTLGEVYPFLMELATMNRRPIDLPGFTMVTAGREIVDVMGNDY